MTRKIGVTLLVAASFGVWGSAWAQPVPGAPGASGEARHIDSERAVIEATRRQQLSLFADQDAACYKKFAVNRCLNEVNTRRKEAVADLRRQEILLNDELRKRRGAEQMRKTEEKLTAEKREEAANRRKALLSGYENRAARMDQKKMPANPSRTEQTDEAFYAARTRQAADEKAAARLEKQTSAAGAAQVLQTRQQEAEARRERHRQAQTRKAGTVVSKPLPLPPEAR